MSLQSVTLCLFWCLAEVHSQTEFPYLSFMGETLPNHGYVNPRLIEPDGYKSVQCHTNLTTCCSATEGVDRGDWYFPNGSRLQFSDGYSDIYQSRGTQRVDLHRRNNADMPSGLYCCQIALDDDGLPVTRTVYVGVYASMYAH